jgi:hypothetical protein
MLADVSLGGPTDAAALEAQALGATLDNLVIGVIVVVVPF